MLSREDMLRELELLPVWQLRNPTPVQQEPIAVQPTADASEAPENSDVAEVTPSFRYIVSKDGQWGFVLPLSHDEAAETLLQNMLKAVSVTVGKNMAEANANHLTEHPAQVIVTMGEHQAQTLLDSQETLTQLRGKAHTVKTATVIATYAPSDLLANVQDKAKAWEDLCLAKFTIANL